MDPITHVRLWAHLLWIGWLLTAIFLVYLSRGRTFHVTHTPVGIGALVSLLVWYLGLFSSVRGTAFLPRETIVPILAALELGSVVLAWAWIVLCGHKNFRIEFRRNSNTSLLIVVWLTMLFLG